MAQISYFLTYSSTYFLGWTLQYWEKDSDFWVCQKAIWQTIFVLLHPQVEESTQKMNLPNLGSVSLPPVSMFHLLVLSLKVLIAWISSACPLRAQGSLSKDYYLALMLGVSYTDLSPLKSVQISVNTWYNSPIFQVTESAKAIREQFKRAFSQQFIERVLLGKGRGGEHEFILWALDSVFVIFP